MQYLARINLKALLCPGNLFFYTELSKISESARQDRCLIQFAESLIRRNNYFVKALKHEDIAEELI